MPKRGIKAFIVFVAGASLFWVVLFVFAADLTNTSATPSDNTPLTTNTHSLSFDLGTDHDINRITIQYGKTSTDETRPNSLDLSSVSLANLTGLTPADWNFQTNNASSGQLTLYHTPIGGETKLVDDTISFDLVNVVNPELGDCSGDKKLEDTCYIFINTYDTSDVLTDSGSATYEIVDEPTLSFTIEGVDASVTNNGITTSAASTYSSLDFGILAIGTPKYLAHKLTTTTNAPNGYQVLMRVDGYMQGLYPANKIDPFAALNASWSTPQSWSSPFGTLANYDTGWIGANTSDTRVEGWASASGKFGPASSTNHPVMYTDGIDRDGTAAYVSYAIEVNAAQPGDSYAGTIIYTVVPTY